MIQIECDNCERPFEARDEDAGGKVPCPYCGDVNRVPEAAAAERATPPEPAEPAEHPEPAEPPGVPRRGGPEREICVVRPAMFRAHPFRYLLIMLMLLGGLVGAAAAMTTETRWSWLLWPALMLSAAAVIWFISWWIAAHWWVKLIVSNKRTVRHEGIVRRHTTEVLHDHVRSVDIRQTFFQRILKVGTIGIDSAGQDDVEIEIHDIPRPYRVKAVVDKYRRM